MKRSDRRKDAQLERQLAKVLGFTKPWKSTPVTLDGVAKNANGDKKPQSTRLLKAECGECGYTVRVTKKWLEAKGAPICPCSMKAMTADMPEAPGPWLESSFLAQRPRLLPVEGVARYLGHSQDYGRAEGRASIPQPWPTPSPARAQRSPIHLAYR
jgi:hypothetical protein